MPEAKFRAYFEREKAKDGGKVAGELPFVGGFRSSARVMCEASPAERPVAAEGPPGRRCQRRRRRTRGHANR